MVHIVQTSSGRVMFSKVVMQPPTEFIDIIMTSRGTMCELFIALSDGNMIRISEIPIDKITCLSSPDDFKILIDGTVTTIIDSQLGEISHVSRCDLRHHYPCYFVHSSGINTFNKVINRLASGQRLGLTGF
jgi:hypothetical protein